MDPLQRKGVTAKMPAGAVGVAAATVVARRAPQFPLTLMRVLGTAVIVWGTGAYLVWYGLISAKEAWDEYKESEREGPYKNGKPDVRERMFDACRSGDTTAVEKELASGGRLTDCEPGGYTPLLVAVVNGQRELVQHLLQLGADVEARNEGVGRTALHIAAQSGDENLLRILLAAGSAVSSQDRWNGYTALHIATLGGYKGCARLLISQGADISAKTYNGRTAFQEITLAPPARPEKRH